MQSLLTVTSLASSYDLTVLDTAKSELGVSDSSLDDKITLLIHQTSSAISTICDRVFAEESIQEVWRLNSGLVGRWHGWAREENPLEGLILRRRPVSSITSVVEDGTTVDAAEYELDGGAGILYRLTNNDYRTTWLANKLTVNYVAGYVLLDDLPYDIEKACLLWMKSLYAQSKRSDMGIRVEDVPDVMRLEYFDPNRLNINNPPPEVMVLLNPYIESAIR